MPRPVAPALIAEMLQRHGAALELYAAQWTAAADDCVQEALVELACQQTTPENPRAWLYRVVRNRALNMARSANRRAAHEEMAARLRARKNNEIEVTEVSDAVATLASEIREVVVLRVWGQLTWQEIAEVTNVSSSTAERQYQSALQELRKIWEYKPCPMN